jgi:Ca2+-binding EF-hand superfamily protein
MCYFWDFLSNVDNYEWVVRKAFNTVDTNGSGEISSEEILNTINYVNSYYDTGVRPTEEQLKIGITYCDVDKNGKISFNEFMELLRKLSKHDFSTPVAAETHANVAN